MSSDLQICNTKNQGVEWKIKFCNEFWNHVEQKLDMCIWMCILEFFICEHTNN